jgi:phosphoribosylaminoimidazole-succinocarboxamide synthase
VSDVILSTNFPDNKLFKRGKVRDVYEVNGNLLIVSTDRISAFDVILPEGIPQKGAVLNKISLFWFDFLKDIVAHHVITAEVSLYPKSLQPYRENLEDRSMLVKKTQLVPFECVVRGYLVGSAYKEYLEHGRVCGIELPKGLRESDKLPQPMFTPATKEEHGHDINVDEAYMRRYVGDEKTKLIKKVSLDIYEKARLYAETKGIIIADTKLEFGFEHDTLTLIDEVLTPDSSRFWPCASYQPGQSQPSFDKQYVRDYLESINWNKLPPAPHLPSDVIEKTSQKYKEALRVLAGITL